MDLYKLVPDELAQLKKESRRRKKKEEEEEEEEDDEERRRRKGQNVIFDIALFGINY